MMPSTSKLATATATAFLLLTSQLVPAVRAGEMDVGNGFIPKGALPNNGAWKRTKDKVFSLQTNWKGKNFKNGWSFFNWPDPTNGMVNYLSQQDAISNGLFYTDSDGLTVMKVDNSTWLPDGGYRNSVRITSNTPFTKGDLLILDAQHMPWGCATWPAFWTVGANWPYGGEIDIIEGTNTAEYNKYTLHTGPGCEMTTSPNVPMAGTLVQESCDAFYNQNTGCGITDPNKKSYGQGFNKIGGGVFATLWDDDGLSIWFFARGNIPNDITKRAPRPSKWGKPRAYFPTSNCAMDDFFGDQTIVFDTTLCGDWAGSTYSGQGCPGTCSSRVANPTNFDEAYWKVEYVRIYN